MQAHKIHAHARSTLRPLIAVLAVAAASGAWADEPSPYYIGASQSFTHDSNVYRVPNGPADNYSSTGLLGGFDQTISRQRLHAAATVNYNKYRSQSTLDNTSYGVNAGWDWATIDTLTGNVNASANQSLASFNNNGTQPLAVRNLVKTDQIGTSVRWGGEQLLTLEGTYAHSRVRYSTPDYTTPTFLSSRSSSDSASAGAYYRLGADLKVGTALRFTRTDSPYAIALTAAPTGPSDYRSNTTNSRDLDLSADWRATEQTGVNARLSWTRQTNTSASALDFSGLTGAVSASFAPTAKLTFNASASRNAGSNSSLFSYVNINTTTGTAISSLNQNSQTTDSYALGVAYAATAKITLNAGVQYNRAKLVSSLALGGTTTSSEHDDNTDSATFGANYAIARNWLLACNLAHLSRKASGGGGFSYSDSTASCSAQFTLR